MDRLEATETSLVNAVATHSVNLCRQLLNDLRQDSLTNGREHDAVFPGLEGLIQKAAKYDDVITENERLRELSNRLQHDLDNCNGSEPAQTRPRRDSSVSYEVFNQLREKYERLSKELEYSKRQTSQYKLALQKYKNGYTRAKISVRSWQEYADRMRDKFSAHTSGLPPDHTRKTDGLRDLSGDISFDSSVAGSGTEELESPSLTANYNPFIGWTSPEPKAMTARLQVRANSLPPDALRQVDTVPLLEANSAEKKLHRDPNGVSTPAPRSKLSKELGSSQSTENEQSEEIEQMVDTAHGHRLDVNIDNDLQFVSSRPVKRRKQNEISADNESKYVRAQGAVKGSHEEPIKIKEERSSSPIRTVTTIVPTHNESMDLDEIPGSVGTPRRNRRLKQALSRMKSNGSLNQILIELASDEASENPMVSGKQPLQANGSKQNVPIKHEHAGTQTKTPEPNGTPVNAKAATHNSNPSKESPTINFKKSSLQTPTILRPLSVNKRILPREEGSGQRVRQVEHQDLAKKNTAMRGTELQASEFSKPSSTDPFQTPTALRRHQGGTSGSANPRRRDAQLQVPNSTAKVPASAPSKLRESDAKTGEKANEILPEDEPLRSRPLKTLRLDDFKVNPKSNQGYNYAFDEVVRNRQQRRCLPGCTRPECCGGQFRKVIEIGGALMGPSTNLWASTQDDQQEEQRLLEDFLGEDRGRLLNMEQSERDELLVLARARQFAERHGKHRQAYERPATPPGFWRTDMPTTQEQEDDRERLKQFERQRVEERYMEAMRSNGRWTFRDE